MHYRIKQPKKEPSKLPWILGGVLILSSVTPFLFSTVQQWNSSQRTQINTLPLEEDVATKINTAKTIRNVPLVTPNTQQQTNSLASSTSLQKIPATSTTITSANKTISAPQTINEQQNMVVPSHTGNSVSVPTSVDVRSE